jgi:probable nitrogen fixation protein
MTKIAILENPNFTDSFSYLFLQELNQQIRLQDRNKIYDNWSDRLLLEFLVTSTYQQDNSGKNINIDYSNQLLISAFYQAIAKLIEHKSGYSTQAFVHLKNQKFSSAVVFCGGVLVVYSLIWENKKYAFDSIKKLTEEAHKIIEYAMAKASLYLDFAA